jgi:hypothetical protein
MKTNYRKAIKFAVLSLTALLIGLASVAAYSEMFMYGTGITIGTAGVKFVSAGNTTTMGGGDAINTPGTEVTFDTITIEPGQTLTYDQAVNITNSAGSAQTINISFVSLTGPWSTNFDYINVTMIDPSGTQKGNSIEIVSSGSNVTETTGQSLPNGETWTVRWIIKAKTGATETESISITFKVKVED